MVPEMFDMMFYRRKQLVELSAKLVCMKDRRESLLAKGDEAAVRELDAEIKIYATYIIHVYRKYAVLYRRALKIAQREHQSEGEALEKMLNDLRRWLDKSVA